MRSFTRFFLKSSDTAIFFLLFALALIPRILCVAQVQHSFLSDFVLLDSEFYDRWASDILRQGFWNVPTLYPGAPLYAHVLATIYALFGQGLFSVRITQALMGALTTTLIYFLAKKVSGSLRFAIAVFLTALFFRLGVFYELWILSESFASLFLVAFLLTFIAAQEKPSIIRFFLAGCLIGLLVAIKPNFFILFVAALIGIFFVVKAELKSGKIYFALGFFAAALIVLAPITIRNYEISGEFIPFRSDSGVVLYEGNGPYANGRSSKIPFFSGDKLGMLSQAKRLAEREEQRNLTDGQVSRFWAGKVREHVLTDFPGFLKTNLIKIRLLVSGFEMPDIYSWSLLSVYIPALRFLFIDFFFLIPLAVAGIILVFFKSSKWHWLGVAALVSAASLFYSYITERYKMPLYPFFILFAVAAVFEWMDRSVSKQLKIAALIAFGITLALAFDKSFVKENRGNDSAGYNFLGAHAMKHHHYEKAIHFFNQALAIAPPQHHSTLHTSIGMALQKQGKRSEAVLEYQKALLLNPYDDRARKNLLDIYKHADL